MHRRTGAGAVVLTTVVLLAGCGTPPWERAEPSGTASSTPDGTSTATASPEASPSADAVATGDLAGGNTSRSLTAGAATLAVDYWTDLAAAQWTAGATKPVSLSVTASEPGGAEIYLQRLRAVPTALDASGAALESPAAFEDASSITPGYLMSDPYSYSTSFSIGAVDPATRSIRLDLTYEVLQRAQPGSGDFAKQTAHDTLTLGVGGG